MEPWTILGWILVFLAVFVGVVFCIAVIAALWISIKGAGADLRGKSHNKN
jgi:hypothetical protein